MAALKTAGGGSTDYPFFLKHTIESGIVTENYVGFVVTPEMATANPGMVAGTYYLRGADNGAAYNDNKTVLQSAFGNSYCVEYDSSFFNCNVTGFSASTGVDSDGWAGVGDATGSGCSCSGVYSDCDVILDNDE